MGDGLIYTGNNTTSNKYLSVGADTKERGESQMVGDERSDFCVFRSTSHDHDQKCKLVNQLVALATCQVHRALTTCLVFAIHSCSAASKSLHPGLS